MNHDKSQAVLSRSGGFQPPSIGQKPTNRRNTASESHRNAKVPSQVCSTNGVEFLGYQFHGVGGQIRVSEKNVLKFQPRAKEITRRNCGVSMSSRLRELGQYVRGWTAYFCLEQRTTLFKELDKWLRRRIRACYWKWWKNPRTRGRNLLQLGVRRDEAVTHGSSRKGPWRMSESRAMHMAMGNEWLADRGLLSLEGLWTRFAPKR